MFGWFQQESESESSTNINENDRINEGNNTDTNIDSKLDICNPIFEDELLSPKMEHYPLHFAVLSKDIKLLKNTLDNINELETNIDDLILEKNRLINRLDHHGYNALTLAVLIKWNDGIDMLLKYNASPTVRNGNGWSATQECISTSQKEILIKLFKQNMNLVKDGMEIRGPILRKTLRERKDFYIEIDWKFSTWIPFLSRFCPYDTFKIWKYGSDFRIDISLIDFKNFKWERGNISILFKWNKSKKMMELHLLNHDKKNRQITTKDKEFKQLLHDSSTTCNNETDMKEQIELLMQSELMAPYVDINNINVSRSKTWLGYDKIAAVNGLECECYQVSNVVVDTKKRNSHVPIEVQKERNETKRILKQNIPETDDNSDENGEYDVEYLDELETKFNETKNDTNIESNSNPNNDNIEAKNDTNTGGNTDNNSEIANDEVSDIKNEGKTNENNNQNTNDNTEQNDNENNNDTKENKADINDDLTLSRSEIKYYEYKEYIPPNVDIKKYFSMSDWMDRQRNLMNAKKSNSIKKNRIKIDKKTGKKRILIQKGIDTFEINKAPTTHSTKKFKLNLYMIQEFGLKLDEILVILDAIAKGSTLAQKLKQFLEIDMPPGFPVRLELPLYHVLKGTVTFQNFKEIDINPKIFEIPNDYTLIEENKQQKKKQKHNK
mmetsp:Transcript_47737/g.58678  ORF Transcript_47737/g.58678 Transcript_47737/m.58678 type:complete len:666 (-) Transcript_47737:45-2042(-)